MAKDSFNASYSSFFFFPNFSKTSLILRVLVIFLLADRTLKGKQLRIEKGPKVSQFFWTAKDMRDGKGYDGWQRI